VLVTSTRVNDDEIALLFPEPVDTLDGDLDGIGLDAAPIERYLGLSTSLKK
jgi:hypothetical protein